MNPFTFPFSWPVVERLGWVLVHSLWQLAVVALLAGVAAHALRRHSAALRYGVLVFALALVVAAPVVTWALQPGDAASRGASASNEAPPVAMPPERDMAPRAGGAIVADSVVEVNRDRAASNGATTTEAPLGGAQTTPAWSDRLKTAVRPWLAWIVAGWGLGVLVFSLRPLLGWHALRRLRRVGVSPAPDEAQAALTRVAKGLGLRHAVRVLQSTLVHVPVVVGYARPLILLPVSLVTCIPPAQLEAILAHELAHVRRHDFVINLLQTLIETLFFYHPAVWWLSRQIRDEREHCCDDLVVELLHNRVEYGRALVAIEQMRGQNTVLALGATDGSLLARVRRILGIAPDGAVRSLVGRGPAALLGLACLVVVLALSMSWGQSQPHERANPPQPPIAKLPDDVTSTASESLRAPKETPDKSASPPTGQAPKGKPALSIAGRVLDADTGKPIANCRMIPTSVYSDDSDRLTWQSQYVKEFTHGHYIYETNRPWDKTILRIEAAGYRPANTRVVAKGEKAAEIDVKLVREVFAGIVLLPNGEPAAQAQLAIASHTNEVTVRSGKLTYGSHGARLRKVVEADEKGRFELPAEIDPSVVVAAHEAGYAEMVTIESAAVRKARELQPLPGEAAPQKKTPNNQELRITVRPWGRIEGRVLAKDKPVVGAKYWVYQSRADNVFVWASQSVESDVEGRFVVERIPAGPHGMCQRYCENSDGKGGHAFDGLLVRFDVPAGKTTTLQLGSPGRTLAGKLALPEGFPHKIDWTKVSVRVSLQPPRFNRFGDDNGSAQARADFLQSDEGKLTTRDKVAIDAAGAFRIEGLPAAEYQLTVQVDGQAVIADAKPQGTILRGQAKFEVPAVVSPAAPATIDLGAIKLMSTLTPKNAPAP